MGIMTRMRANGSNVVVVVVVAVSKKLDLE